MNKSIPKINKTVIDSHCHLNKIKTDINTVLENASQHGVDFVVTICTELAEVEEIKSISKKFKNVFCSFGIHPHSTNEDFLSVNEIMAYAKSMNAIGIGETGLDYFYDLSDRKKQIESFKNHIIAASKLNIPVIIHSREAENDTIMILEEMKKSYDFKAILHCYSSNRKLADYAIKNNIYLSASGIITFNKSQEIQESFKQIPKNLLLVETDAPFLAPTPFRGKECEPVMTILTLQKLAELHNTTIEKMAEITTQNFKTLFKNVIKN